MNFRVDPELLLAIAGVAALLVTATLAGLLLKLRARDDRARATLENLNARIRAWWVMCGVLLLSFLAGRTGTLLLFGLLSFLALREYITLTPTRRGDHRTLFWSFFIITPLQYFLVGIRWYGFYSILIPVFAFVFVPTRIALAGDTERFLERAAKIQWGLMVCAYCVSYAPALLMLDIPGYEGQNFKLLFYLLFVDQISDVLQYVWGKLLGRHAIAPTISPNKTWEGFVGGIASATLLGSALYWLTPFSPLESLGMSLAITLMGFFGGLTM